MRTECDSCLMVGIHTPATRHSKNPDYSNYDLCEDCAAEFDSWGPFDTESAERHYQAAVRAEKEE